MVQEDRREQKRLSLSLQTKVTAESRTGSTPLLEFVTADISAGGAFIATSSPLPIASKVCLEFFLSLEELAQLRFVVAKESLKVWEGERAWVTATGVVIRVDKEGAAVIFDQNYQISPIRISDTAPAPE
ncbi:MAG: PilZ domain-containing protein [Desulfocapsaceae bacterium]|nr:PilZ domain-containing protein [Desulfocapsaceae bacterium]